MNSSTAFIFRLCAWLFACSLIYGGLLAAGLSHYWSAPLILLAGWGCFRSGRLPLAAPAPTLRRQLPAIVLLVAVLTLVLYASQAGLSRHGHWDAWWFWNPRAAYLTHPDAWRLAFSAEQYGSPFTVPVAHSDYPPFLPLLNALSWRWLGAQPELVPFCWSALALLLCCSLLFLELLRKQPVVALAALYFLSRQQHFLQLGTAQIADIWMALFLLMALVAGKAAGVGQNNGRWLPAGLALGLALWMKNEGLLMLGCFLLVNAQQLLQEPGSRKRLLAGLALPLLAWMLFKLLLAPANDIVQGAGDGLGARLLAGERYTEIGQLLRREIDLHYPALPWLLAVYALVCLLRRRAPDRYFWMLLLVWAGYCGIYLISPHNLGWHVNTSADRLISQLYPALIFLVGEGIADLLQSLRDQYQAQKAGGNGLSGDPRMPPDKA